MENSLMRKNRLAFIIACIMFAHTQSHAATSVPHPTWFHGQISTEMFGGKSTNELYVKDLVEAFRVIFADLLDKKNKETFAWHLARLDAFRNVASKRNADKAGLKKDYDNHCHYYVNTYDIKSAAEFERCISIIVQNLNNLCTELAKPSNQTVSNSSSLLITCLMSLSRNLPSGLVNRIQSTQGKTSPIAAFGQLRSALRHRLSVK